jgi:hypothetical protein
MAAQPFEFPHRPTSERMIELAEDWTQGRPTEPTVVVYPAAQNWIAQPGYVIESPVTMQMEPPAFHFVANLGRSLLAHGGAEVDEVLSPPVLRPTSTKGVSKEIEFLIGIRTSPLIILAVDDFRLVRM